MSQRGARGGDGGGARVGVHVVVLVARTTLHASHVPRTTSTTTYYMYTHTYTCTTFRYLPKVYPVHLYLYCTGVHVCTRVHHTYIHTYTYIFIYKVINMTQKNRVYLETLKIASIFYF